MGSDRINDIKSKISSGMSFQEIEKAYPMLTFALFTKLGGYAPPQQITINNDYVRIITGHDEKTEEVDESKIDKDLIIGTLLGDGNIARSKTCPNTHTFSYGHTWGQIGYVKLKYELLKPFVNRVRMMDADGLKDYSFHVCLRSLRYFSGLYSLFYTARVADKINSQKDVLKKGVFELLNPKSFAFWLMDDGKRYGKGFSICVGKQPYYDYGRFSLFVEELSSKLGWSLTPAEYDLAYEIRCNQYETHQILEDIRQYIWPDFYYKVGCAPEELGSAYKSLPWYDSWKDTCRRIEHPSLIGFSMSNYKDGSEGQKELYLKNISARAYVRGFPFYSLSDGALQSAWETVKRTSCKERDKVLRASFKANIFPSIFMNHRFFVRVAGRPSPYDLYLDRKKFKEVLKKQLERGSNIQDSNVRNAIGFFGTQVAGQFSPCFAKFFVERLCPGRRVLDPCAGWGGRLSGVVSCGKDYYGVEPESLTYNSLIDMKVWFKDRESSEITLVRGVAEQEGSYTGVYDFAITSPPYFNLERYSDAENQSCVRFPTYGLWKTGFLSQMIKNVYDHLKPGCYFVLNVADFSKYSLILDSILISKSIGFILHDVYKCSTYNTSSDFSKLSETFLVLLKPAEG